MLAEPITTLTDYAIALEASFLAGGLLWKNERNFQRSRFFWGVAFGWVAVAAAAGGTCHGFAPILTLSLLNHLWHLMGYAIGCASFFMLLGTILSVVSGWLRWVVLGAIGSKSAIYFAQVGQYEQFVPVAIDYLSAILVVLVLQFWQLIGELIHQPKGQRESALWLCSGIVVSLAAGIILAFRMAIAPFNHNDLYHLVQMVGLYLLYRGARVLKDR
ncbi:DUF6962 family protein [Leptolyngbya ohadii]|uniref:DUF6962 family protein n=1 Tax=Leptolyngbya ohadii TaxID=1962290 RepID=UPI000B59E0F7|nr:hypothetical protein [Leptolyngbya ohadii]